MADSDYKIVISVEGENKLSPTIRVASGDLKRFADDTKNASNQTQQFERQTQSMSDSLRQFAGGVLGGLALREVINFAEGMNELGTQVNANRVLFEQLTRTLGGSASTLRELRDATGGVVDDMNLMAGANQLLRLGVTETADQTADLIGMIQRLKQPTDSTTDAIQNFALMLSNESLLRLDSFGISSANVKRRMDELGQSFREATMAEMAGQIERLGSAADVAVTPLARIQTAIDNIRQSAGANINTGVNSVAGFLLALYDVSQANYELVSRAQQVIDAAGLPQSNTLQLPFQNLVPTDQADAQIAARATVRWFDELGASINRATTPLRGWIDGVREARLEQQRMIGGSSAFDVGMANIVNRMGLINDIGMRDSLDSSGFYGRRFSQYLNADEAQDIFDHYQMIKAEAERIKEAMGDALSDQQATNLDRYVSSAKDFADEAERAKKAFENLNLAGLLGTTGGGAMGELTDRFLSVMRDRGVSDDTLQQYRNTLDLASGRETNLSQGLDEFLGQLSYMTPSEVATAMDNLQTFLREARRLNLPPDAYSSGNYGFFAGVANTGTGEQGEIVYGDNTWTLADRYGGKPADYNYLIGDDGIMRPGKFNLGGGELISGFDPVVQAQAYAESLGTIGVQADVALDPMVTDAEAIVSSAETFKGIIDDLTGSVHQVTIDLAVTAPAILEWLFGQVSGGDDPLAKIVRANGGVVPGSDPRGRQIER